jgi:hypothetical protein
MGIQICNYHADNGRFADTAFINDTKRNNQSITYCGVYAHFQNEIAEKRIRDHQERTRTMIIHAKQRWPEAINAALWPYALRLACDIDNCTPKTMNGTSPIEEFANVQIRPKLCHYHTFGCPAYVFINHEGTNLGKWEARARLGICVGISPKHARSVHLILNPNTGLVSPQYHVKFDDLFQTVKQGDKYEWKHKCHQATQTYLYNSLKRQIRTTPNAGDCNEPCSSITCTLH